MVPRSSKRSAFRSTFTKIMYFQGLSDDRIVPLMLRLGVAVDILIEAVRVLLALIVLFTAGLHFVAVFLLALASKAEPKADPKVAAFAAIQKGVVELMKPQSDLAPTVKNVQHNHRPRKNHARNQ